MKIVPSFPPINPEPKMPTRMPATLLVFRYIISQLRVALLTFLSFLLSELTLRGILVRESLSVAGVLAQPIAILLETVDSSTRALCS